MCRHWLTGNALPAAIMDAPRPRAGQKKAVVANPRNDTVSREVLRHPDLAELVRLGRVRNHFICACALAAAAR